MHHLWQARLSLCCLAWVLVLVHAVFVLVHVVFVLVQGVFVLVEGVFVLVHEVFVSVHGVFVLVHGVFVLVHRVFVLVHGVLGLRFRNTRQLCPISKTSLFLFCCCLIIKLCYQVYGIVPTKSNFESNCQ